MKTKKAGLLTKLVVLALLIGLSITLLDLRSQLLEAQTRKAALTAQVQAQTQVNADLADAVENSDDPQRQMDIARDELGLTEPQEKILKITD
ncbi:MAG: septum formation initiator family protein [Pseudoflavonifractor sp.]